MTAVTEDILSVQSHKKSHACNLSADAYLRF